MPLLTLQAVQHIRKMRGGSQAHLIRASDKNLYVVKFQNNPQHVRVLVNEYLGTTVGRLLNLPIPEARIMEMSDWLIENTPELKIDLSPRPDRKSTRLNSSHVSESRMPSSA